MRRNREPLPGDSRMIDTESQLQYRTVTLDQAQAHYETRDCPEDHDTIRCGTEGWEIVTCPRCQCELAAAA